MKRAIETKFFGNLNTDSQIDDIQQEEYIDALNIIDATGGSADEPKVEAAYGNVMIPTVLPSGTNKCIGTGSDIAGRRVFWANYNSLGNHGIYYIDETNTSYKVLQYDFKFEPDFNVSIKVAGEYLVMTDSVNEAIFINIQMAINGYYDTAPYHIITLCKRVPPTKIENIILDDTATTSQSLYKGAQFTYRYIYKDKTVTPFAPYSEMKAPVYPSPPLLRDKKYNGWLVLLPVDPFEAPYIDEVQIAVRTSDTDKLKIVHIRKQPLPPFPSSITFIYNDTSSRIPVPDNEAFKITNLVPPVVNGLMFTNNRLFISDGVSGFDINEADASLSCSLVTTPYTISPPTNPYENRTFKTSGRYRFGVVYYDYLMRPAPAVNEFIIDIPRGTVSKIAQPYLLEFSNSPFTTIDTTGAAVIQTTSNMTSVQWTLTGKPPKWAHYYSIVRTNDLVHQEFFQTTGIAFFQAKAAPVPAVTIPDPYFSFENNPYYFKSLDIINTVPPARGTYRVLYINPAVSIPFAPSEGWFCRILTGVGGTYLSSPPPARVISFDGTFIICEVPDGIEWYTLYNTTNGTYEFVFEFYYPAEANSGIGYEASPIYYVSNPATPSRVFTTTTDTIKGDVFLIDGSAELEMSARRLNNENIAARYIFGSLFPPFPQAEYANKYKILTQIFESKVNTVQMKRSDFIGQFIYSTPTIIGTFEELWNNWKQTREGFTQLIGRPIPFATQDVISLDNPNTIRYSNVFTPQASIVGINEFELGNSLDLSFTRSSVVDIIEAGVETGLVIHEKTVTSLYLGQGIVKFNEGSEFLGRTDSVIGSERKSETWYGTQDAGSLANMFNKQKGDQGQGIKTYWLDRANRCIVRNGNNGAFPVSDYKMQNYFRSLIDDINESNDNVSIVGGIDLLTGQYIITINEYKKYDFNTAVTNKNVNGTLIVPLSVPNGDVVRISVSLNQRTDLDIITATTNGGTIQANSFDLKTTKVKQWIFTSTGFSNITFSQLDATVTYTIVIETSPTGVVVPATTIAFNEKRNTWKSRYSFAPERYATSDIFLVSFKDGIPYIHNDKVNRCNYYGVQYPYSVTTVFNELSQVEKSFDAIEGVWNNPAIEIPLLESNTGLITDIRSNEIIKSDNVYIADIPRASNTDPSLLGANQTAYQSGDVMEGQTLKVNIVNQTPDQNDVLDTIFMKYTPKQNPFMKQ